MTSSSDPRQVAATALNQIPFHRPWSIETAIAALSLDRQRPITLHDLPDTLADSCSGLWIPQANTDQVYIRRGLIGAQREVAIAHEIGHILLEHGLPDTDRDDYLSSLFPLVPRDIVAEMFALPCTLARSNYEHPFEMQAEWFARLMVAKADLYRDVIIPPSATEADRRMLMRAAATFGWP
ncbi:MAG: hypothetical protein C0482_16355 [Gordonia sp.]|nr:hypothetical protein [Gordonia sp. (in: high G+C Gram-positive bacteria)]